MASHGADMRATAASVVAALRRCADGATPSADADAQLLAALAALCRLCDFGDGDAVDEVTRLDCLAHAGALMEAGAPDVLAQLLHQCVPAADSDDTQPAALAAVASAVRALFAPAAHLRGRDPAAWQAATSALECFGDAGGIAAAAALLSHDSRAVATAPLDALAAALHACPDAPAEALQPLCSAEALTQLLCLAGGSPALWREQGAALVLLLLLLEQPAVSAHVAMLLTGHAVGDDGMHAVLSGGGVPLLLALVECAPLSSLACDVLRCALGALPAEERAAVVRPLRDAALPRVTEALLSNPEHNIGAALLLRHLTDDLLGALSAAAPLPPHAQRCLPLLQQLCAAADADDAVATRATVLLALATLAAMPAGARVVKTFASPRARTALLGWLCASYWNNPRVIGEALARAAALSAAERRDAGTEAQCARQLAAMIGQTTSVEQDRRDAAASPAAPLLAASRAAAQPRAALALARANVMARYLLLYDVRDGRALSNMRAVAEKCFLVSILSASADAPHVAPFAHSVGIAHSTAGRAPELVVLAGGGSAHARLLRGLAPGVLGMLLSAVCMAGAERALALASEPAAAFADDNGVDAVLRLDGARVLACLRRLLPGAPAPPAAAAAAARRVTWLFREPRLARDAPPSDASWRDPHSGAYLGRARATFYIDAAAATLTELACMPTLVCSLADSMGGVPHNAGAQLAAWLAQPGAGGDAAAALACACAACGAAAAAQRRCAYADCACHGGAGEPRALKRCGRCMAVAYCSPEAQAADWPRHKAACVAEE
jgi:hypothetical protein